MKRFNFCKAPARKSQSPSAKSPVLEWLSKCARVQAVPEVSLQGLVNVVDNGIGGRPDGAVVASLPIPIFNRNQGATAKAQSEVVAAEQALAQLELSLKNRLAPTYERYANARNEVERYRVAILPAATESLDLSRRMYQAGEASYLNLLTAKRTFAQTNLQYYDSLRQLRIPEPLSTQIEIRLL